MDTRERKQPERYMITGGYEYRGTIIMHDGDGAQIVWNGLMKFFRSTQEAEQFIDEQLKQKLLG